MHTVLVTLTFLASSAAQDDAAPRERPGFERSLQLEETAATSANIAFGDLDGDGDLDVLLAKGRHWPLRNRVLFGDGEGGIEAARDLGPEEERTYTGALADFDGDGALDVLVSNEGDPQRVYRNDGKGSFHVSASFGEGWPTRNSSVADVDGDGHPDVLVANRGRDSSNYLCRNDGSGGFREADCVAIAPYSTTTITAADFDADGRLDLLVPCRDGGQSYVHVADDELGFPEASRVPFGPADASIRIAVAVDLDGDGALDVAAVDDRRGTAAVYVGRRDGGFEDALVIQRNGEARAAAQAAGRSWRRPYALASGDLDADGRPDLVVGNWNGRPHAYFRGGASAFTAVPFGDDEGGVYGIDVADFDGDGRMDIGLARSDAPNVVYFGSR